MAIVYCIGTRNYPPPLVCLYPKNKRRGWIKNRVPVAYNTYFIGLIFIIYVYCYSICHCYTYRSRSYMIKCQLGAYQTENVAAWCCTAGALGSWGSDVGAMPGAYLFLLTTAYQLLTQSCIVYIIVRPIFFFIFRLTSLWRKKKKKWTDKIKIPIIYYPKSMKWRTFCIKHGNNGKCQIFFFNLFPPPTSRIC